MPQLHCHELREAHGCDARGRRTWAPGTHLAPDPDALVEVLGERLPRDEAAHALADADGAVLEDNLALADDHQRGAVALCALEDVVLRSLPARTTAVPSRLLARPRGPPQCVHAPSGHKHFPGFVWRHLCQGCVILRCVLFHLRDQPLAIGHLG